MEMTKHEKYTQAWEYIHSLVKAMRLQKKHLEFDDVDVHFLAGEPKYQMTNLATLCEWLNIDYFRDDWDGNSNCGSNWDIIWFVFAGIKFFELVDKEGKEKINEGE